MKPETTETASSAILKKKTTPTERSHDNVKHKSDFVKNEMRLT